MAESYSTIAAEEIKRRLAECDRLRADVDELVAVLSWYRERAEALASQKAHNPDYALAVVTELSLDAGGRARAALAKHRPARKPQS